MDKFVPNKNNDVLNSFLNSYPVILEACKNIVQGRGIYLIGSSDFSLSILSSDELELTYYDGSQICSCNVYFDEINDYFSGKLNYE